jgi:TolB-like protein
MSLHLSDPSRAVFLSYASQDAAAALKICEALRAAGIEVWFDQSELRGGDAWDASIRKQIKTCALFVPLISHTTHDRAEGYFRLEWKLAVDRSHLMASDRTFLLPVVVDETSDQDERVPERFREVQWSRLPGGYTSAAFVERVRRLLSGEPAPGTTGTEAPTTRRSATPAMLRELPWWRSKAPLLAATAVVVLALGYLALNRLVFSKRDTEVAAAPAPQGATTGAVTFTPPPHSIAVLPFVNLSGDATQDYFSDGLTEELLNSLAEIDGLQVAARTSSFSFKDHPDITTVAHRLNVGTVLEGSVRRSAHTVRITAQLINAVTGFHQWSKTYDRDLGDVLKLQTEISTAVAQALKVTLLGDTSAKIELGGTRNPAAFDAYLRGLKTVSSRLDSKAYPIAIAQYTEAIRLDPGYALAFARRSNAYSYYAEEAATGAREGFDKAQADARHALNLAPDLAQAHLALALVLEVGTLDFKQANDEYQRALALSPGNADVLRTSGQYAVLMGHFDVGVAAAQRAVVLDPLARASHGTLGNALFTARRYQEAVSAYSEAINIAPDYKATYGDRGLPYYELGDLRGARASCEVMRDHWTSQLCLAVTYDKLQKHDDAEVELAKFKSDLGNAAAYQYATIYAQWGNSAKALEWLDIAMRVRDPGLENLKTDPLIDPIRQEPRFQALLRQLKFPD